MGLHVFPRSNSLNLYGTTDRFKIEKGARWGCLLSPWLFKLYADHIMRNSGLDELQAGIKIDRNISNSDMQMIPV